MKSIITLSALTLAGVTLLITSSPAQAQDRGTRFTFSPNRYLKEQPNVPVAAYHPPVDHHKVGHGMAKGNFLSGVDPNFLKPVARPQTQVAVIPQMMPQQNLTGSFHHSFGKPEAHEQPTAIVAHNTPMMATPKSFSMPPQAAEEKVVMARKLPSRSNNANLSGKMLKRPAPRAQIAKANSMVASYGNSKYYSPGAFTPSAGGASEAKVYGHVIPRK
ncbi:MAG: hypothetical protein IPG59_23275 [Candidatus Melainabacteria bacterium]|nr:MAG: hypothetical protein IPG59_23275 [Candidatus Melainabacteria bacterium]